MRKRLLTLAILLFVAGIARAQGPATVTVTDTLVTPSGLLASGTITVSNNVAMTSLDGFVIPQGQKITVKITNGVFAVPLVPNIGASPSGSIYFADYSTPTARYREQWVVPQSSSSVNLAAVRVLWPASPNVMIPAAQFVPPPGCAPPQVLRWTLTGWICAPDNTGAVTFSLENPTTADSGKFQWKPKNGLSITRISCSVDSGIGNSVSVNLDVRQEASPNSAGTFVLAIPIACGPSTAATTTILNGFVPGDAPVALVVTSISGSPSVVRVHAEYQLN